MGDDRNEQSAGQGIGVKDLLSENVWRALILTSAAAVLLFSIYCLSHGITIIFMHLYYFPIVLLAYRYRYRGFVLATLLAIAYIGLVYFYDFGQVDVITGAWYRFIVFIGIAAVVAYLSERLAAAHRSQKEALDTIRNLQQFQESVITNANVWITVLAPDGTIIVWNDAAEAIGGYKRGDVLGMKTVWKNLYPDKVYRQKVTHEIQRVIGRDTYLENFETEIRCADGTQKTIVWNTRGIRDPTGTIQSYIAIGRDITEQKRAEKALRERETLLNEVGEMAHVGGWELDVRTKAVHWTTETYRIHDISEDERFDLSKAVLFFDLPGRSRLEGALQRCMETGEPFDLELPFTSAKGRHLWTRAIGRAVSVGGEVVKLEGAFQDITEHRRAKEAVRESEGKYRTLIETTGTGFVIIGDRGQVLDANLEYVHLTGHTSLEEIAGRNVIEWTAAYEKEKNAEAVSQCMRDGYIRNLEIDYVNASGTIIPIEINATVLRSGDAAQILTLCRDITERKRAEHALKESEDRYRNLYNSSRDAIMTLEPPSWKFTSGNPATIQMFMAKDEEEFISKEPWVLSPTLQPDGRDSVDKAKEMIETAMRNGSHFFEWTHRRLNGEDFPATVLLSRVQLAGKVFLQATVRDINERKKADDELRLTHSRLESAMEAGNIAWWEMNCITGNVIFHERKARMLGYPAEQFSHYSDFTRLLHPDDHEPAMLAMRDCLSGIKKQYEVDYRIRTWNGDYLWFHDIGNISDYASDGKPLKVTGIVIDITERKRAEKALRETNEYLNNLFDYANAPIIVWDPEYVITRFNHAFEDLIHKSDQEVIGQRLDILFPKESRDTSLLQIKKTLEGERWETVEIPILVNDGSVRTVLWNSANILDPDGRIISTIAQGIDITGRKHAEEKLKFSNVLLSTQQEVSIDGILVVDESGKIISFNRRFIEIWGIPQDVVASRSDERALQSVIDKLADPEEFMSRVKYLYTNRDEKSREEITLKDGRVLDRYSAPMSGSDGKYYGRIWNFRDITERKRAEDALRESNEYLHMLIDFANAPIIVWDPEFRITRFNHAFESLTGRVEHEVIEQPLDILFPKESRDNSLTLIKKTLKGEHWETVEIPILTKEGGVRTVLWNSANILDPDGRIISTIAQGVDITERKRAEEGIRLLNATLEQRVRDRTQELEQATVTIRASLDEKVVLLREIHHRVKNNLQIILSLIRLQSRNIKDPYLLSTMEDLQNRIMAMAHVHERMCLAEDISRIDLSEIVTFLWTRLFKSYNVDPHQIRLNVEMKDLQIIIDSAIPISLIINELVSNSLKHAFPQGTPGEITIAGRREADTIVLSFRDTGIGIPKDLDWKRSNQSLGFRLVVSLVEQLNGTIELDRTAGTAFTIVVKG